MSQSSKILNKKDDKTFNYLLAILILFGLPALNFAQTQPRTVTDFYLAMPTEKFSYNGESEKLKDNNSIMKYRRSIIKIEDIKNGYLKIESSSLEGWAEIALFKKTDGSYLVAFSEVGCGPDCEGEIEFLTFKNGVWTNVTKQFHPTFSDEDGDIESCFWKLPRVGRTLILSCGNDADDIEELKEFSFGWNGAKFVKK